MYIYIYVYSVQRDIMMMCFYLIHMHTYTQHTLCALQIKNMQKVPVFVWHYSFDDKRSNSLILYVCLDKHTRLNFLVAHKVIGRALKETYTHKHTNRTATYHNSISTVQHFNFSKRFISFLLKFCCEISHFVYDCCLLFLFVSRLSCYSCVFLNFCFCFSFIVADPF